MQGWASITMTAMTWAWVAYAVGVLAGLIMTDGRPMTRVTLALLWPLGPAAFVVVVAILVLASFIAFPIAGLIAVLAGVAAWLFF